MSPQSSLAFLPAPSFSDNTSNISNSTRSHGDIMRIAANNRSAAAAAAGAGSSSSVASAGSTGKVSQKSKSGMRSLPLTFTPGPYDVICARGKEAKNHAGNLRYRKLVSDTLERYSNTTSKIEKTIIVSEVVENVRTLSCEDHEQLHDGGFVKFVDGQWFEVGDHLAREKVGQSFRDSLHTMYKSSTKAKKRRRDALATNGEEEIASPKRRTAASPKRAKTPRRTAFSAKKVATKRTAKRPSPETVPSEIPSTGEADNVGQQHLKQLHIMDQASARRHSFANGALLDVGQVVPTTHIPPTTFVSVPSDMFLSNFLTQTNVDLLDSLKTDEARLQQQQQQQNQQNQYAAAFSRTLSWVTTDANLNLSTLGLDGPFLFGDFSAPAPGVNTANTKDQSETSANITQV